MNDFACGALFESLTCATIPPEPFSAYTAESLWNDPHISKGMLDWHLSDASRDTSFVVEAVDWICEHFNVGPGTDVLDLGCGPGRYTSRFAEIGASVVGVDVSERSIAYAREAALFSGQSLTYLQQNYLEYHPTRLFDLVTLIHYDYGVLSPKQRLAVFHRIRESLKPDGFCVLNVQSFAAQGQREPFVRLRRHPEGGFYASGAHFEIQANHTYDDEPLALDKITIVEPDTVREIYNWTVFFNLDSLRREFASAGLELSEPYGDVCGRDYDPDASSFAVVGRRAA